ncbi:MAG: VanZ family protein [Puniceicoccales bacterium]|jgi:VanZ family protein|nr:VanZ family protein [Puniceicoccales bacterium]
MKFSRHLAWLWPIFLIGIVCYASGRNPVAPDLGLSFQDKIAHFFVFGLLANLFQRSLWKSGLSPLKAFIIGVAITSCFGALDELHQSRTPGREMDFYDWLADTSGALLASGLYFANVVRYRSILEFSLFGKNRHRRPSDDEKPDSI